MAGRRLRRLRLLSRRHRSSVAAGGQATKQEAHEDQDMDSMNIPWQSYKLFSTDYGASQQRVPLHKECQNEFYGTLSIPRHKHPAHIVMTCPGMYRCTEGPGCLYNQLASVLPAGNVAVLQIESRLRCQSISDGVGDLSAALDFISTAPVLSSVTKVVLVGWSMGGAVVVEVANQVHCKLQALKEGESCLQGSCLRKLATLCSSSSQLGTRKQFSIHGLITLASIPWGMESLSNLLLPLLVVHGRKDNILPSRSATEIARLSPSQDKVKILLLESATHSLEDPTLLREVVFWLIGVLRLADSDAECVHRATETLSSLSNDLCVGADVELTDANAASGGAWTRIASPPGWHFIRKGMGKIISLNYSAGPDMGIFNVKLKNGKELQVHPRGLKRQRTA